MLLPEARVEAERLISLHGPDHLPALQAVLSQQFQVLQARSQLLLTLATITLTITGFSGPRIAGSHPLTGPLMAIGLSFVLLAVAMILFGTLRIRWVTQFIDPDDATACVARIITYRNRKTKLYIVELGCLVLGLAGYVSAVITYLFSGHELIH